MNILILNWRDIKNPKSGGAEILTHEIAKRWVKLGNSVWQISSSFPKSKKSEIIDGVKIIRKGHPDSRFLFFSVHFFAFLEYQKSFKGRIDAVVDEIHGIPFFTPWYVREKKIALICEVAGNLWVKMFGTFFGFFGRIIEKFYLRFAYKNISYLTISNSTKGELMREGVKGSKITVLPMGLTIPKKLRELRKEKDLTLIFVGRLSRSKGIEDAIKSVAIISKTYSKIKLWIVGSGEKEYLSFLKEMAKKNMVDQRITFWGFVSEERKFELMSKAHVLLATSSKEGWGLTIPEAGLVGTPAIGYNVSGIREVIQDRKTGYLTRNNNPDGIFNCFKKILEESEYKRLSRGAKKLSLSYNWNNTAKVALNEIFMEYR